MKIAKGLSRKEFGAKIVANEQCLAFLTKKGRHSFACRLCDDKQDLYLLYK